MEHWNFFFQVVRSLAQDVWWIATSVTQNRMLLHGALSFLLFKIKFSFIYTRKYAALYRSVFAGLFGVYYTNKGSSCGTDQSTTLPSGGQVTDWSTVRSSKYCTCTGLCRLNCSRASARANHFRRRPAKRQRLIYQFI